jgi:DNA-binding Lrp family transcriptional regulator
MSKPKQMLTVVNVFRNQIKRKIVHLLHIYQEQSTFELAQKLGKSKPTILRHIEDLVQLGFISYREITDLPGKYAKRVYSLRDISMGVQGQNLRSHLQDHPETVLAYNEFRTGLYTQVQGIINSCLNYLERMRRELKLNIDNPEEILELTKDNLGAINFKYLNAEQAKFAFTSEKKNPKAIDEKTKTNDYLHLQLLLPIRRLIEIETSETWFKDGQLWTDFHSD